VSIFKKIAGVITSPITAAKEIAGIVDKFVTTGEERHAMEIEIMTLVQARDSEIEQTMRAEMEAKERVLVAELQQGDNYTKRARPTVVYAGLALVLVNNVILPWVAHFTGSVIPAIDIPGVFWTGWSGITATWFIGRSAERRGVQNKFVAMATGS
jgi:hypothetical protein